MSIYYMYKHKYIKYKKKYLDFKGGNPEDEYEKYLWLANHLSREYLMDSRYTMNLNEFKNATENKFDLIKNMSMEKYNFLFEILGPLKFYMDYEQIVTSTSNYILKMRDEKMLLTENEFKNLVVNLMEKNTNVNKISDYFDTEYNNFLDKYFVKKEFELSRILGKQYLDTALNAKQKNNIFSTPKLYIITDSKNINIEVLINTEGPIIGNIYANKKFVVYEEKIISNINENVYAPACGDCYECQSFLPQIGYLDVGNQQAKRENVRCGITISDKIEKKYIVDTEKKSFVYYDRGINGMLQLFNQNEVKKKYLKYVLFFIYSLITNIKPYNFEYKKEQISHQSDSFMMLTIIFNIKKNVVNVKEKYIFDKKIFDCIETNFENCRSSEIHKPTFNINDFNINDDSDDFEDF